MGVSTRTLKRTSKRPAHNILGVVAQVVGREPGQPAYRVVTAHGMINTLLPSNCLVHITEGNPQAAPTIIGLRGRLAQVQDRETGTLRGAFAEVTIDAAYEADIANRSAPAAIHRPRTQPSRKRTLDPLATAAAAASAVEVTQRAKQHMVKIIGERRLEYRVQWSLPEADPVITWQRKSQLDNRAEYMIMVLDWKARDLGDNTEVSQRNDEEMSEVDI